MKFVLTTLLFVAIIGWSSADKSNGESNTDVVSYIEKSMQPKANPCADFKQYACGKLLNSDDNSALYMVGSNVDGDLSKYMDETDMADAPEFVKKSYDFYSSCLNTEKIQETNYIRWLVEHENMKSALLTPSESTDAKFDWVRTLGIMRRYGMNDIFISEELKSKKNDPSKVIIELKNPDEMYNMQLSLDVLDMIKKSMDLSSAKQISEFWNDFITFDDLLVKLYDLKDQSGEQLITVKELPLPWLNKYLGTILQQSSLDSNMEVTIQNMEYMEALDALLKEYDDTFICRYLEVRFLYYINNHFEPHSKSDCFGLTKKVFPIAMHWIYEQLHPEVTQYVPKVEQMFGHIIDHINQTLRSDKADLVSKMVLAKLDNMQVKVGNLPRVDTIQALNSHYDRLKLNKSDIYGNYLSLVEFYFYLEHLRTTIGIATINTNEYFNAVDDFNSRFTTLTPYYLPTENIIIVPSEILQPPFYSNGYDDIFKYGSLGTMVAQSIYDNLEFEGLGESGSNKLAHIISLSASTEIVFSSFPAELNEKHYTVNGEQMSMKKLFFLNAAQQFCVYYNEHDVQEQFSRNPKFAETFECKLNVYLKFFQV